MRECFSFDPEYINMNHGSYGSLPSPVAEAIKPYYALAEANPDLFHRFTSIDLIRNVRERMAKFIGAAHAEEVVFVPNASHGLNTILRDFTWNEGDIICSCNTSYKSISTTAQYISDIPPHPENAQFSILFPTSHTKIIQDWRAYLQSLNETRAQSARELGRRPKIVAIIDSIISVPGALLPWKEMVKICKEEDVWSVVDGAHSIGQEPDLNLAEADPDFWVTNCHKWLYAKRSCALLYVPKRNQHIIKASFPTSHAYISPEKRDVLNFVEQFEWNGTIDFVPYISASCALDFRAWLGGEHVINAYCHRIALEGGKRLAQILGTEIIDEGQDFQFTLNMVNVAVPFPPTMSSDFEIDMAFRRKLLIKKKIYPAFFYHNGKWWTRCSAQVWSQVEDFEFLGEAILEACKEIVREFGDGSEEKAIREIGKEVENLTLKI
ncbi:pyridoxal phosphate-dependent transferase [Lentinula aciculospora]|uniref:Pyridoxal phosphate-dependent transferase n=1 Tax=Lentinula aciculospora TaxID=153920 RepID=A0A9W9ADB5_9AGAR|nr:pyridoxal phosphate-dependent transferase [Lentinula aciculospora]